jgi:hypothetical protein
MKDFPKSVAKIKVSLKSDKNNGTLHGDQYIFFDHFSLSCPWNEKCSRLKLWRKSKHTFNVQFFFENHAVYEIIWKNIVEPARPQLT